MTLRLRRRVSLLAASVAFALVATLSATALPAASADEVDSPHTQRAYSPYANYTMKWTRADIQRLEAESDQTAARGANTLPEWLTMPNIPRDFPIMTDRNTGRQIWVWDTWPLTDEHGNQYSYKGWNVIFSLTADPYAGYTFDDRHVNARIGFWFRRANDDTSPWIWGGRLFGNQTPKTQAEWSGSTRIFDDGTIRMFYTHMDFTDRDHTEAKIALSQGRIQANANGVWFTGFRGHTPLLEPDGEWYQNADQNAFFSFRDPFTFEDPKYPGKTFMVFEGNTGGKRGDYQCQASDLGASGEDPDEVTAMGANFQMANVGLAVATNSQLTKWKFLPPILSGNCVNDQTERPQFVIKKVDGQWKYYLFTISHAFTAAAGIHQPDGVYGFVGNGIRSDFVPLNGHGLTLGNPMDLRIAPTDPDQNPRIYQSYSHYVMPGGLVTSFIDNVAGRRGGTLAPTVKVDVDGSTSGVDRSVGNGGLLGYGYIPAGYDISPGKDGQLRVKRLPQKQLN